MSKQKEQELFSEINNLETSARSLENQIIQKNSELKENAEEMADFIQTNVSLSRGMNE